MLRGKGLELLGVLLEVALLSFELCPQECHDFFGGGCLLWLDRQLGKVRIAQGGGVQMTVIEQLPEYVGVVELACLWALIRCAGAVGLVHLLAQETVVGVVRNDAKRLITECQQPSRATGFPRLAGHLSLEAQRQAAQSGFIVERHAPGLVGHLQVLQE